MHEWQTKNKKALQRLRPLWAQPVKQTRPQLSQDAAEPGCSTSTILFLLLTSHRSTYLLTNSSSSCRAKLSPTAVLLAGVWLKSHARPTHRLCRWLLPRAASTLGSLSTPCGAGRGGHKVIFGLGTRLFLVWAQGYFRFGHRPPLPPSSGSNCRKGNAHQKVGTMSIWDPEELRRPPARKAQQLQSVTRWLQAKFVNLYLQRAV